MYKTVIDKCDFGRQVMSYDVTPKKKLKEISSNQNKRAV